MPPAAYDSARLRKPVLRSRSSGGDRRPTCDGWRLAAGGWRTTSGWCGGRARRWWSTKDLASSVTADLTEDHWANRDAHTGWKAQGDDRDRPAPRDAIVVVTSPDQARALELADFAGKRLAETYSYLIEG